MDMPFVLAHVESDDASRGNMHLLLLVLTFFGVLTAATAQAARPGAPSSALSPDPNLRRPIEAIPPGPPEAGRGGRINPLQPFGQLLKLGHAGLRASIRACF